MKVNMLSKYLVFWFLLFQFALWESLGFFVLQIYFNVDAVALPAEK